VEVLFVQRECARAQSRALATSSWILILITSGADVTHHLQGPEDGAKSVVCIVLLHSKHQDAISCTNHPSLLPSLNSYRGPRAGSRMNGSFCSACISTGLDVRAISFLELGSSWISGLAFSDHRLLR